MVDIEARRLAETFGQPQLETLLAEAQEAFDNADRISQEQPSPQALTAYRSAERRLQATERALELVKAGV